MLLNGFSIENKFIDSIDVKDDKFADTLCCASNIIGDVYFDGKLVLTSRVYFHENLGHLIANIKGKVSFEKDLKITQITIRVHQFNSDVDILVSSTNVHKFIESGDQEVSLFANVMPLYADLTTKCHVPKSTITWMHTNTLLKKKFDDLPDCQTVSM